MSESDGGSLALVIEGARKDYGQAAGGRREAVTDVSLTVSSGAIHGLLGPNGAGKTTTLKMLLGLVRPTAGRFEILGRPAHEPGSRARLGFLPEQPYFPSQLTAAEALTLYGRLGGISKSELATQSLALLEKVGLEGREGTLLARFSRGMLQRLGLAQALLGNPRVVVLDEPASGLDPVGQRDVRNIMTELRRDGVTVLLSSHQLSEVEAVCDEVSILDRGRVAARGHIDSLLGDAGWFTVRAAGDGALPETLPGSLTARVQHDGRHVFDVAEHDVRAVVDGLDDAGWRIESVLPKRDSLEDYFARMLESTGGDR